jgi:hypothetical protein
MEPLHSGSSTPIIRARWEERSREGGMRKERRDKRRKREETD